MHSAAGQHYALNSTLFTLFRGRGGVGAWGNPKYRITVSQKGKYRDTVRENRQYRDTEKSTIKI